MLPAAIAGGSDPLPADPGGKRIPAVDPLAATGGRRERNMADDVKENNLGPEDLAKLREALQGLDIYSLALVWDFAQYLLRLQTRIEQMEKARRN
ncbi:hypothetical protein ES703_96340 [subsurface metagenome]